MGRKTFESIGCALPDRRTIVVTRNADLAGENIVVAASLDEAIRIALEEPFEADGEVEVFVVGGGEIYRQVLGRADRMYLTRECQDTEWHAADEKNPFDYTFETWERKRAGGSQLTE
jgi:dihydrofolate reductase